MYGIEAWTLKKANDQKIQTFEMCCFYRILNISWVDNVTNVDVLRIIGKKPEVLGL